MRAFAVIALVAALAGCVQPPPPQPAKPFGPPATSLQPQSPELAAALRRCRTRYVSEGLRRGCIRNAEDGWTYVRIAREAYADLPQMNASIIRCGDRYPIDLALQGACIRNALDGFEAAIAIDRRIGNPDLLKRCVARHTLAEWALIGACMRNSVRG